MEGLSLNSDVRALGLSSRCPVFDEALFIVKDATPRRRRSKNRDARGIVPHLPLSGCCVKLPANAGVRGRAHYLRHVNLQHLPVQNDQGIQRLALRGGGENAGT
jgi:hypothetical protein